MSDYELGEMDRRMACLTQSAIVEAVTYDPPRVKVRIGDWVSDWLKWQAGAAGKVRQWRPPSVDEEVALWAPSGDLAGAFVAPGYYTDQHGGSGRTSPDETAIDYPDGAFEQYNHATHDYTLSVPAGGRILFRIGSTRIRAEGGRCNAPKRQAARRGAGFHVHGQHDDGAAADVQRRHAGTAGRRAGRRSEGQRRGGIHGGRRRGWNLGSWAPASRAR